MELEVLMQYITSGVVGILFWVIKTKSSQINSLETRVTTLETTLNIIGDLNKTLNDLKVDVEVIKNRLNQP